MKAKKKQIVVDAEQITDATFDGPHPNPTHIPGVEYDPVQRCVFIETKNGRVRAEIGEWIITGVEGEIYPCSDAIFRKTYEPHGLVVRPALMEFVEAMERKLLLNERKGGWSDCDQDWLFNRLLEEQLEYLTAKYDGDQSAVEEMVDMANFAMMIWDNGRIKFADNKG